MNKSLATTIDKQCGSRGRMISMELTKAMGMKCYDKGLLSKAAEESGLRKKLFETYDKKPTGSFLCSPVVDTYSLGYVTSTCIGMPINHEIFLVQFNIIEELAEEESCVIVGRYGDYVLADYPGLMSVFIIGDEQDKINHLKELYGTSESEMKDIMIKAGKKRASYYNYYANKEWGDARSYSLCINSSSTGIDGAIHIIQEFTKAKQEYLDSLKAK